MTSRDFAYWLQGFLEISNPQTISESELKVIKDHLQLVFVHEIDPSINEGKTPDQVSHLNDIHAGLVPPHLQKQDPSKPMMRC